ncbi:hypothetical protein [Pseudoclavibacter helvolus]|nr:hypothetical protein [Pseudoclavibacter helvolus]
MVKIIGVIRPTATQPLGAEGESYEEAKANVAELVPDGWELIDVRADKS